MKATGIAKKEMGGKHPGAPDMPKGLRREKLKRVDGDRWRRLINQDRPTPEDGEQEQVSNNLTRESRRPSPISLKFYIVCQKIPRGCNFFYSIPEIRTLGRFGFS